MSWTTKESLPFKDLAHRLSELPVDLIKNTGPLEPLLIDLLEDLGAKVSAKEVEAVRSELKKVPPSYKARHQAWVVAASWLLSWENLKPIVILTGKPRQIITGLNHEVFERLRHLAKDDVFLVDPDRKEEFIRYVLKVVGLHPKGENTPQAERKFESVDVLAQARAAAEAKERYERAQQVEAELKKKEAEEAASKPGRE